MQGSRFVAFKLTNSYLELKQCSPPNKEALGFTANDVISLDLEYYLLGETAEIRCADGESQTNRDVTFETITCQYVFISCIYASLLHIPRYMYLLQL